MKRYVKTLSIMVLVLFMMAIFGGAGFSQAQTPLDIERLYGDGQGAVEITWNQFTGTPSFVRGVFPIEVGHAQNVDAVNSASAAFLARHASLFGIQDPAEELIVIQSDIDLLGMSHVTFQQVYQGVIVYGAHIKVHVSADGENVVAVSSGFVPRVAVAATTPSFTAQQALGIAGQALPGGISRSTPQLVVYASPSSARLAWLVELLDNALPARNVYVIDALTGTIIDVQDRLYVGRDRLTHDANQKYNLPGTLKRSEGDDAVGDQDVDNAHDFAGATYDYFWNTHNRDSYDNAGASLVSTANYGSNYMNAFWNGEQMVYGDSFAVKDVVAHELTHAVTEYSADLEYRWQSGALNESFSDIFGAMVDRDDWLMGEDLPDSALGGREAIRDLADPARFGQPGHTDDWVRTCSDNQGVHTNSGIPNKAYHNIATTLGKDKAERIFYRTLTVYLDTGSSLEDARAGALQSATDLYGANGAEYNGVRDGFNAVGLDGQWNPEPNDCTCAAATVLADSSIYPEPATARETAATLYQVRDQLLTGKAGGHYLRLYETHTAQISRLLIKNATLRGSGADIMRQITPGLDDLMNGNGDQNVVTQKTVDNILDFLQQLVVEANANGNRDLAETIEVEMAQIDWGRLVGMTYADAWQYLQSGVTPHTLYLPIVAE